MKFAKGIPSIISGFAIFSMIGCTNLIDNILGNTVSIKTEDGSRIVFKREDVNCILWDNGGSYPHTCRANGVKTDLTGRKSVYSDSETCPDDDYITCIVAEKFELF